jgi:hypothetical protein
VRLSTRPWFEGAGAGRLAAGVVCTVERRVAGLGAGGGGGGGGGVTRVRCLGREDFGFGSGFGAGCGSGIGAAVVEPGVELVAVGSVPTGGTRPWPASACEATSPRPPNTTRTTVATPAWRRYRGAAAAPPIMRPTRLLWDLAGHRDGRPATREGP